MSTWASTGRCDRYPAARILLMIFRAVSHLLNSCIMSIIRRRKEIELLSLTIRGKTVKKKPAMPWYNDEIKGLKRDRRKAERQWLQHRGDPIKNVTFGEEYRLVRNRFRSVIDEAKTEYYSGKVQECAGDQKKLFEIIKSLTKPLQQEKYPDSDSSKDLADAFGDFFIMKIQKIRTKLDSQDPEPITIPRVPVIEEDMLLSFQPLTEDDVRKLIKQSPNKQCSSDPIPTWLLKECLDSLLPVLTLLVNKSLQIGYFPEKWKNALVKPLLKKLGLELVFPNFRPVSNLPFISKLAEKASVNQLSGHMNKVRSLHRASQLIDHSTAQKRHFWRYSLIFYWTWMIRKSLSLPCLTSAQHSTQLTTVYYWKP